MKNAEIKALSVEELKDKIATSQKSMQSLKFAHSISPIENPAQIKDLRKLIAKLKTELHARTIDSIIEKVKSGELTNYNVRTFFQESTFDSQIKLSKVKEIVEKASK